MTSPASLTTDRPTHLLAVDLGLRCGLACFLLPGPGNHAPRLRWYRSTHFGSPRQMKDAIRGILREASPLAALVLEGDRTLATPWQRTAERRGARSLVLGAETWRNDLLHAREQRSGGDAKRAADRYARDLIRNSELSAPHSLRHDAAEAILIGWWACTHWFAAAPPAP
ncbi:MAG: hypothetical protein EA398_12545 [Deltaproteobacteria bacterium]|nr:MAG: hypothetical protein EA398_12545 [Deltaproteobacteria bacterium]